jgi:hypothetical protein
MAETTETSKTDWEITRLVRIRLFPDEWDERHPQAVLRSPLPALFEVQPEVRRQMVIRAYTAGELSIGRAAQMMQAHSPAICTAKRITSSLLAVRR